MQDRRVDHALRLRNAPLDMLEAEPGTRDFYRELIGRLTIRQVPFLVGGTFALQRYTGITRRTKDLDLFIKRTDFERVESALEGTGCHAELVFPHWLGKVFKGPDFVDLAFRSGNGEGEVDDDWFRYSIAEQLWGIPIRLCPPEETIWSKGFIFERERHDGADIIHIIRATAETLDWQRLLRRFGQHWRVLLSHLILFGFVYPSERRLVPDDVMRELVGRLESEEETTEPICRGTLLSREQYLVDIDEWGYIDPRVEPLGKLTPSEIVQWTAAIEK